MKCALCGEEMGDSGYRVENDVRIRGVKVDRVHPVTLIKDLGNVCSRRCQIASKIAYLVHVTSFKLDNDPHFLQALAHCNCTEQEFEKGLEKYCEIMDRKIFLSENDFDKHL